MDIIVYTRPHILEHKKGLDGYHKYYWALPKKPKHIKVGDRLYFATEGYIQGYFILEEVNTDDEEMLCFDKETYTNLKKKIPIKPFQGFKYANKVKELKNG